MHRSLQSWTIVRLVAESSCGTLVLSVPTTKETCPRLQSLAQAVMRLNWRQTGIRPMPLGQQCRITHDDIMCLLRSKCVGIPDTLVKTQVGLCPSAMQWMHQSMLNATNVRILTISSCLLPWVSPCIQGRCPVLLQQWVLSRGQYPALC